MYRSYIVGKILRLTKHQHKHVSISISLRIAQKMLLLLLRSLYKQTVGVGLDYDIRPGFIRFRRYKNRFRYETASWSLTIHVSNPLSVYKTSNTWTTEILQNNECSEQITIIFNENEAWFNVRSHRNIFFIFLRQVCRVFFIVS